MEEGTQMVSVKGVSLTIKKTEILKDITLDFSKGQIHGLIGRNGSGKSSLVSLIPR